MKIPATSKLLVNDYTIVGNHAKNETFNFRNKIDQIIRLKI